MSQEEGNEAEGLRESTMDEDTSQEMEIESIENPTILSAFDSHRQMDSTSTTKLEIDLKAPLNLPIVTTNTSIVSPIMIGNVNAASALSSVFQNQEITNSGAKTFLPSTSLNSDLVSSVIPIFLHSSDLSTMSPSTLCSSLSSCSNLNAEGKVDQITTRRNEMHIFQDTQSKSVNSYSFDQTLPKPSLSCSDTIILNPESSSDACAATNQPCEVSLDPNDKKLSLLAQISERSVSLDSIPSLTLFRPEVVSGAETGIINEESLKGATVIGNNKVPSWLIELIKRQNNLIVPSNVSEHLKNNKTISVESTSITQEENTETGELCNASSLNHGKIQEGADMNLDEILVKSERLEHSDTLILPAERPVRLEHSDTLILSAGNNAQAKKVISDHDSEDVSAPFVKITSVPSFGSVSSTLCADSAEMVNEQNLQEPLVSKHVPVSETASSITNFLNSNISQILYPIKIADDPLRFNLVGISEANSASLNQLITSGSAEQSLSQTLGNGSVLIVSPSPRIAEAKETQTDLVLGTNTVFFKAVDSVSGNSTCESGQFPTTLLTMAASTSSTQNDPEQAGHISKLALPSDFQMPEPFMSPSSSAALAQQNIEFIASTALNSISQEMNPNSSSLEGSKETLPYKCAACGEKFSSKFELASHKKSHKNFKCDLCNATFSRMGNYTRHRKIHNLNAENQSGYQCDDCGRKFLQRCDLRRHCLIHTRQEPYRCEICNKGYIRKSDLIVHMRFHNKDRAFKCSFCDKKFFQSGDLNRHVRRAHKPDSELTCGHCDRKYACETTLIRHMKAVHKDIILQAVNKRMQDQESSDKSDVASNKDILFAPKPKL
ncbi:zinc finger protein interacting with ribonucleoprotein K [Elysia marginata]|uniref:Zinc finger protein interacting with ribonucleoprotein K n=1 Tax=Elysia marginata TaxID=1093978 RepID=A0AAV4HA47_9GAST|nr:zinc finger protein interacting with ribonucleoprotein K [Elysia marginata]